MPGRYLLDLAAVCRTTGLTVVEVKGWESRARSSGGYAKGTPDHVMTHHTASPASWDGLKDVTYMTSQSDIKPMANVYISRGAVVYVMAGGCTNTNGVGHDPCGLVPDDSMNTHAVGIEAGNNGIGEPWPNVQQDGYVELVAALCKGYSIDPSRVHAHFEWSPGRKFDPAGPSRWSPHPTGGVPNNLWIMRDFRQDVTDLVTDHKDPPVVKPIDPSLFQQWEGNFMDVIDEGDGEFWRIWANDDGTLKAAPFSHIPRAADEPRFHKIRDRVIGPLVPVPHQDLQDMYDVDGQA